MASQHTLSNALFYPLLSFFLLSQALIYSVELVCFYAQIVRKIDQNAHGSVINAPRAEGEEDASASISSRPGKYQLKSPGNRQGVNSMDSEEPTSEIHCTSTGIPTIVITLASPHFQKTPLADSELDFVNDDLDYLWSSKTRPAVTTSNNEQLQDLMGLPALPSPETMPGWPSIPYQAVLATIQAMPVKKPATADLFSLSQSSIGGCRGLISPQVNDLPQTSPRAPDFAHLSEEMSTPEDISKLRQLKESEPLQRAWDGWVKAREALQEASELLTDPDPSMRALATEEHETLTKQLTEAVTQTFPNLLVPRSKTAQLGALMELKSGVGGSEASLFLADMLRMYQRLASASQWKTQIVSKNDLESGGIKDAIVEIKGEGAYDALRWESGVHRVQRVPATEANGRVHTSTVAVVVLPLMGETDGQNDELFAMDEIKIEVMRARGAGGQVGLFFNDYFPPSLLNIYQHVNRTESAVRLTHIPTGITVSMQDERSQHQASFNKRRAFQVLRSRLMDRKIMREIEERRATRLNLVRTADRSEKIRTYNYAQDRVTDHRIGLTLMNLTGIMEGDDLQEILGALKKNNDEEVMEDMLSST
ncbi:Peptide chain release factor 1 [Leucoagaricus sp. SymC.cos]|nr:Peptide chain release factor 1 [Leucoagaricus sp. SymC.cos]